MTKTGELMKIQEASFVLDKGTVNMLWDEEQDLMISMTIPHEIERKLPKNIRDILDKTGSFRELAPLVEWCKKRAARHRKKSLHQ